MTKRLILIDGYNVLNKWKSLKKEKQKSIAAARDKLIEIIHKYADFTDAEIKIVFDGKPNMPLEIKDPIVIYSKEKDTADSAIERLVYQTQDRKNILVVTSDVMQQKMVFGMGGFYKNAEDFEDMVNEALEKADSDIERFNKSSKLSNYPEVKRKDA